MNYLHHGILYNAVNRSRLAHCHDIQNCHNSIMDCCIKAAQDSIPHTSKQCNSKVIAGWNEHVKPYIEA